jgi:DNA-directed RNA polymerase subunit beta'
MAEISGRVEILSDKRKGKMTIRVVSDSGIEKDHHVPTDKQLLVHAGDYVQAGDPLIRGPARPARHPADQGRRGALDLHARRGAERLPRPGRGHQRQAHRADPQPDAPQGPRREPGRHRPAPARGRRPAVLPQAQQRGLQHGAHPGVGRYRAPRRRPGQPRHHPRGQRPAEAEGKEPAKAKRARPATGRTLLLGITKAASPASRSSRAPRSRSRPRCSPRPPSAAPRTPWSASRRTCCWAT